MSTDPSEWQLQEAKNKLSHVVKEADKEPQFITVHGKPAAVVLSAEAYRALVQPSSSLSEALLMPVLEEGDEALFARSRDVGRDIEL